MSLSGANLRSFLTEHTQGQATVLVSDLDYSLPDEAYIRTFGRRFRDFMFSLGVRYTPERWDCDNYALLAAGLAKLDHGNDGRGETGLAVGFAGIVTETLIHRVFCAVHDVNGQLQLKLYESIPEGVQCLNEFPLPVARWLSLYF